MQKKLALTEQEVQSLVTPLLSLNDLFSFYANNPISLRHIPGGENIDFSLTTPCDWRRRDRET
jgi:hypothetical protein